MNHKFGHQQTLKEMVDYLKEVDSKEITRIMFIDNIIKVEWQ